ncbi:MAG: class II glutamine amidotransferase [Oscillospiraceae bacterium]|nr:class II glutamine amidotransferase [Oscillospiraceae bacterium]
MCAIFGFMDYGKRVSASVLKRLIKALSIEAECRGTDATGISYVKDGKMVTFKKAKPAHKVKLYFPKETTAVMGHTRMTTQGSEKYNYNNHPFEGKCGNASFSLAHNGVLYNDKELKAKYNLPVTEIETDSYVAVQVLEQFGGINAENIKRMSELVEGSFVFTILGNDNTLFLVKGSNPLTLYNFPDLKLYVYASTKSILDNALKKSGITYRKSEIKVTDGEILQLNPDGTISRSTFEVKEGFDYFWNPYNFNSYENELLLEYCKMFGVSEEDVELLLDYGYDADTIEEMLMDTAMLEEALAEIKIGGR